MGKTDESTLEATESGSRWVLIRDIFAFQFKLVVDGLRDFLLVPASMVAGIISLIRGNPGQDNEFYELMRLGQRSEHWINLFAAARPLDSSRAPGIRLPDGDLDQALSRVERYVVQEVQAGGLTRQTRDQLERFLDALEQKGRAKNKPADPSRPED